MELATEDPPAPADSGEGSAAHDDSPHTIPPTTSPPHPPMTNPLFPPHASATEKLWLEQLESFQTAPGGGGISLKHPTPRTQLSTTGSGNPPGWRGGNSLRASLEDFPPTIVVDPKQPLPLMSARTKRSRDELAAQLLSELREDAALQRRRFREIQRQLGTAGKSRWNGRGKEALMEAEARAAALEREMEELRNRVGELENTLAEREEELRAERAERGRATEEAVGNLRAERAERGRAAEEAVGNLRAEGEGGGGGGRKF